jgi:hypothetical protein
MESKKYNPAIYDNEIKIILSKFDIGKANMGFCAHLERNLLNIYRKEEYLEQIL